MGVPRVPQKGHLPSWGLLTCRGPPLQPLCCWRKALLSFLYLLWSLDTAGLWRPSKVYGVVAVGKVTFLPPDPGALSSTKAEREGKEARGKSRLSTTTLHISGWMEGVLRLPGAPAACSSSLSIEGSGE